MRSHSKALFAVAVLFAFFALASFAQAAPKGIVDSFGSEGTGAGQFRLPGSVAINQASGDVYVVDTGILPSNDGFGQRLEQFTADGEFIRAWGWGVATGAEAFEICTSSCQAGIRGSGDGQFAFQVQGEGLTAGRPFHPQIAIDQSDGSVYVADTNNNRIQKFSATGEYLDQFGVEGSGDGEFSSPQGVAVDPVSGDVYVADTENNRIQRFDDSGGYLSQIGSVSGGSAEGEFFAPRRIALDSTGRLYVIDVGNERIQRFTPAGEFDGLFAPDVPLSDPVSTSNSADRDDLVVDPTNDHVFVLGKSGSSIFELDSEGQITDTHAVGTGFDGFTGLAIHSSTGRIYASSFDRVFIFNEVTPPTVTIAPVTDVTSDSATFHGVVNPQGPPNTSFKFECVPSCSGLAGGPVGEGFDDVAVEDQATGLEPNTEYTVKLTATKAFNAASASSEELTFTTDPVLPVVSALDPGPVSATSAWLGAYVNPRNAATDFYVEYSTDPSFASSASVPAGEDASAGDGGELEHANQLVEGLKPQTTYHYRVVATNVAGTTVGESRSFVTPAPIPPSQGLPDGRVWEKVSPGNKSGANINGGKATNFPPLRELSQAAAGGNAIAFGSKGKFGGEGGPATSQYIARRGPGGWSTEGVNLPLDPFVGGQVGADFYMWFSRDLSQGIAMTYDALNPGDPEEVYNLYRRHHLTGEIETVSNADDSSPKDMFWFLRGVSPDESRAFFIETETTLAREGVLQERTPDGDVRPVSVLPPDGTVANGLLGSGRARTRANGFNSISADNSRVYFASRPASASNNEAVYVREDGTDTTLITASERSSDDPTVARNGDFMAASTDGSVAFFGSTARLTDDSNPGVGELCAGPGIFCQSLYRYDADAPAGERLSDLTTGDPEGAHTLGVVGVSDDGNSLYFAARGNLDGNGSHSQPNLYLWRQGEGISWIATLASSGDDGLWDREIGYESVGPQPSPSSTEPYRPARITPDGRYLAFSSHRPQTGYDSDGNAAIYIYDSETGRIHCVSCGSVEPRSQGDSWFFSCAAEGGTETRCNPSEVLGRNFRDDGKRLIFDTQDALVLEDTNGVTDVYEWQEGELHLLSSGTSPFPSRFVDASASGDDVFFTTAQKLTPSDTDDLRDLYDARVGGAPEPTLRPPCVGDECQGPPKSPASFQTPSSAGFKGVGNFAGSKPRCARGKLRRKGRCVKRRSKAAKAKNASKKKRNRANHNRRAGR